MVNTILHTPSKDIFTTSFMGKLLTKINKSQNTKLQSFEDLHAYSVNNMEEFWDIAVDDLGIIFRARGEKILDNSNTMLGGQFFTDSKINFAENLLKKSGHDDCLVYRSEDKINTRLSWDNVRDSVSKLQQALQDMGVVAGDVVAGFVPNCPQAVIAMLATTSLGAVWTSASPDFGVDGVLDRFGQTKPKVLFSADGYYYNNKYHDSTHKIVEIVRKIDSIKSTIIFNHTVCADVAKISTIMYGKDWDTVLESYAPKDIVYTPVAFNDPVFIMYSSGTTGSPKCIVHGVGGTLLSVMVEGIYHSDICPDSRVFFYSTCGWMMWNWLVGQLACSATLLLFDGSPFVPNKTALFDYMQDERATFMGVSAKYIDFLLKTDINPMATHDLTSLKMIGSTGSVLSPEAFDWIAQKTQKNVYISSLSGGTDIVGCFLMGNPLSSVYRGELVGAVLGKAVEVWGDDGKLVNKGTGELMCVKPFPSMPIYFHNDLDGVKYKSAYFEKFEGVWCHGDFVQRTENKGYVIQGRSDSVLNPGGVRIGTAEIYRQVEIFSDIMESVVIGQAWNNDVRVVLFVKMVEGKDLTNALIDDLKQQIKTRCTPRHVPAKIIAVADIPRTRSGKISELAVRDTVMGKEIKNATALANVDSLKLFANLEELNN